MKVHVHWMNLMKNQIIQKFQTFKIWKEKVTRQWTHFLNHLIKKLCSMGSKCLVLDVSHMCRRLMCQKTCLVVHWNSFWEFFGIFYIFSIKLKYLYTIMYDCEKSSLTHELSYIGLFKFSYLSLFYVMFFVKNNSKKSVSPFFLFWYPNCEWTHETYNYLVVMCVPTYVGMYGLV